MAEMAVRGKPGAGRSFRVTLAVLVGCFVLVAVAGVGAFDDDEGGTHEAGADALRAEGILEGTECGEGRICPAEPMLRWVMAVWLVRAVDGADPAGVASGRFSDVSSDEWWAAHVERLAELEVTLGCGDGSGFCPADAVTRAQMATFLVRAFGLDADGGSGFTDIAGNTHEASINVLAAERVTAGCSTSPLRYCPSRSVTRGQMTTFLARALNLVPLPDQPAPPTGQRIAYTVTTEGGNHELWVSNADGTNQTKTTELPDGAEFDQMRWSPDGTHIAYTYRTLDPDIGYWFQLWVADADGTNPTNLSDGRVISGGWSPDSTHIAYEVETDDGHQLWVADADGTNPRELTDSVTPTRFAYAYGTSFGWGWSPDGTHIAYEVETDDGHQLWVADADGANPTKLAQSLWLSGYVWSPDGRRIAYSFEYRVPAGEDLDIFSKLWVADVDGTRPTELTDDGSSLTGDGSSNDDFVWSPDGTHIAYTIFQTGDDWIRQLWVADADGANSTKLTDSPRHGDLGVWSPDGTRIAYEVETDDGGQLWVADADGANPTELTDDGSSNDDFVWSPDGAHIDPRDLRWFLEEGDVAG